MSPWPPRPRPRSHGSGPGPARIPTDGAEADGTFAWDAATLVAAEVEAAGAAGAGQARADGSAAAPIEGAAVDALRCDASRAGTTGFLRAAALCEAHHLDLSGACAPALHPHAACSAPRLRHLECFNDHVRIERMVFDGAPVAQGGAIRPDLSRPGLSRPGLGLEPKRADAGRHAA